MKVLLIHNFYRVPGGECQAVLQQQRLLEENGHEVVTFFRRSDELEQATVGVKLQALLSVSENGSAMRELIELVGREQPQIAHVHNVFPMISPLVYRTLSDLGLPVVQSVHNLRLRCPAGLMFTRGQVCQECVTKGWRRAVFRRCVQGKAVNSLAYADAIANAWRKGYFTRYIDRFIVFNQFFFGQLKEAGIAPQQIHLLPNFVENPYTTLADKQPYALYLGRLSAEKGIGTLLEAWRNIDGLILKIAGSGPLADEVQHRCKTDLAGKAEYLGYVDGTLKAQVLRHASFSLLLSECFENCPISLLESLAAGTAVVVSRMGGLPDIVREGLTGAIVEPGDIAGLTAVIKRFRDTPGLTEVMGARALDDARAAYSAPVHYDGLMTIYGELQDVRSQHSCNSH